MLMKAAAKGMKWMENHMKKNAVAAPVRSRLLSYAEKNPVRLHMPGHKGCGLTEKLDLTEIQGLDPLYPAQGVLLESEENASRLFGSGRTLYSAEGSSLCIRAMLYLVLLHARAEGIIPLVLAGRNAHSSFVSAAALLGLEIRWIPGDSLLTCRPSGQEVKSMLEKMPDPPAAVYLTSPDYLGCMADISDISEICHHHSIPLLVDNAHGAYLRFLPEDLHPLSLGADMTCDSAHKTLPVLTGGAYLHLHRNAPSLFLNQAERALALFSSTSPSWLILRSLDECNAWLSEGGADKIASFAQKTKVMKEAMQKMGFAVHGEEPLKITLAPKSYGYTGDQLHDLLRKKNIECEFSDPDFLVMMFSPQNDEKDLEHLLACLEAVPRSAPVKSAPPPVPLSISVFSPKEALLLPSETLPLEKTPGRILSDLSVSCPPAVPILVSGERITEEAVRCFRYYGIESLSCIPEAYEKNKQNKQR